MALGRDLLPVLGLGRLDVGLDEGTDGIGRFLGAFAGLEVHGGLLVWNAAMLRPPGSSRK